MIPHHFNLRRYHTHAAKKEAVVYISQVFIGQNKTSHAQMAMKMPLR
jgi:hypothetical protein